MAGIFVDVSFQNIFFTESNLKLMCIKAVSYQQTGVDWTVIYYNKKFKRWLDTSADVQQEIFQGSGRFLE